MATDAPELEPREAMECDVVVVGAGPAGLATAIRLKQLAAATGQELAVIVLETVTKTPTSTRKMPM